MTTSPLPPLPHSTTTAVTGHQRQPPWMDDEDGWIGRVIGDSDTTPVDADETPLGRIAGINRDIRLIHREMYRLLTDRDLRIGLEEYEERIDLLVAPLAHIDRNRTVSGDVHQ